MRSISKLLSLAAMALTALALTAASASAQLEVHYESTAQECGNVTNVAHHVEGGCHIEFRSTHGAVSQHVYVPSKVTISSCELSVEGRVGENGEGFIKRATFSPGHIGGAPCTRVACDEDAGTEDAMLPWPFHIREFGPGEEWIELTFCIRLSGQLEGTTGAVCEVHLELENLTGHEYEIGDEDPDGTPSEEFCENNPPNPTAHPAVPAVTSVEAHLLTSGTERVEIIH